MQDGLSTAKPINDYDFDHEGGLRPDNPGSHLPGSGLSGLGCVMLFDTETQYIEINKIITEAALDAIIMADSKGMIVFWNPAAEQMFGYSTQEALGKDVHELLAPRRYYEKSKNGLSRLEKTGWGKKVGNTLEMEAIHKDGTPVIVSLSLSVVDLADGFRSVAILRDITAQKQAEKLRSSQEKVSNILSSIEDIVWSFSLEEEELVYVNPSVERIMGITPQELKENCQLWLETIYPDDVATIQGLYYQLDETGWAEGEYRITDPHGNTRWIRDRIKIIQNALGEPVRVDRLMTDFTHIKQAEIELLASKRQAEEANIAKGRFLSNMSHEIRTPMAGILGMLDILSKTVQVPELVKTVTAAKESARSLLNLINDILDTSKIETGKIELSPQHFRLRRILARTMSTFSVLAVNKGLKLIAETEDDVPDVLYGDCFRLEQILKNLVSNAIKFTEKGGVVIKVSRAPLSGGGYPLLFEVRDTGIGIPDGLLPNLFQRFTQADSTYAKKYGGTGLGLSIARDLVELMGGKIWAESRIENGSSFFFTVTFQQGSSDRIQEEVDVNRDKHALQQELAPLKILVADDIEINQDYISFILDEVGQPFKVVSNGAEALEAYKKEHFDIILMDIQMPEMDGMEATRLIRNIERNENRRHTPIIALTAYAIKEEQEEILATGMDGYVIKPFDAAILFAEIRRVTAENKPVLSGADKPTSHEHNNVTDMDMSLIDMELVERRYGDKAVLWKKTLDKYIEKGIDRHHQELTHAIEKEDLTKIHAAAHSIKGTLGVICAEKAMKVAQDLELAAKHKDMEICKIKMEAISDIFDKLKKYNKPVHEPYNLSLTRYRNPSPAVGNQKQQKNEA